VTDRHENDNQRKQLRVAFSTLTVDLFMD
jgi:hypothetical protein